MNYRYDIGCSLANLKNIREFIRTSLKDSNISDWLLNVIVLAMDEMCSNIMIHAHQCNPNHILEIHISQPKDKILVFEIVDEGYPFDINQFQESNVSSLVHKKKRGGLGIRLVKSIMDKVEYDVRGKKNVCRLTKKISGKKRKS